MAAALAFVPVNGVINAFNILAENLDADLQPILDHMGDNYLDHMRLGHCRAACFPMAMWNVHDRVLDNLPRTNNGITHSQPVAGVTTLIFGGSLMS